MSNEVIIHKPSFDVGKEAIRLPDSGEYILTSQDCGKVLWRSGNAASGSTLTIIIPDDDFIPVYSEIEIWNNHSVPIIIRLANGAAGSLSGRDPYLVYQTTSGKLYKMSTNNGWFFETDGFLPYTVQSGVHYFSSLGALNSAFPPSQNQGRLAFVKVV